MCKLERNQENSRMVNHSFAQRNLTLKLDNRLKLISNKETPGFTIILLQRQSFGKYIFSWWFIDAANETYHFSSQPVFA